MTSDRLPPDFGVITAGSVVVFGLITYTVAELQNKGYVGELTLAGILTGLVFGVVYEIRLWARRK